MMLREAKTEDIPQILLVRNSVLENQLTDPNSVTDQDCIDFLEGTGKGWVYESESGIVGFSMIDLASGNVWALFILPEFEGRGIGRRLHKTMMDWYFSKTRQTAWLGTEPDTRAERFYQQAGWQKAGIRDNGELKFEMSAQRWQSVRDIGSNA